MKKTNKRSSWKSKLPKFWQTARRYRWLMIWIGIIIFSFVSSYYTLFPNYPTAMLKPDIIIPPGFLIEPDYGFHNSFVFYVEKPDFEKLIQNPDSSNPAILNDYLKKKQTLEELYEQKTDKLIKTYDLFPVTSEGNQRICVVGSTRSDEHSQRDVYLMDNQFNVLDQVEIYGSYFQYFVSAKFRDRMWIQTGDGGNGGYLVFYEIRFKGERLKKKIIGEGSDDEYQTYLLRNSPSDPKIIIYHKPFTILSPIFFLFELPFFYEYFVQDFLQSHWFMLSQYVLFFVVLLLLWLFTRKKIKTHLSYIRTTFLSLFKQHLFPHQ